MTKVVTKRHIGSTLKFVPFFKFVHVKDFLNPLISNTGIILQNVHVLIFTAKFAAFWYLQYLLFVDKFAV